MNVISGQPHTADKTAAIGIAASFKSRLLCHPVIPHALEALAVSALHYLCSAVRGHAAIQIADSKDRLAEVLEVAKLGLIKAKLAALEQEASADGLWDDVNAAKTLMSEINNLKEQEQQMQR